MAILEVHPNVTARLLGVALSCLLAAACGGSSGGPDSQSPTAQTYAAGVSVSGLEGSGLTLQLNDQSSLEISANGSAAFAARLAGGQTYTVTVTTQPTDPGQTCSLVSASGSVQAADVTVAVQCLTLDVTSIRATVTVADTVPAATSGRIASIASSYESSSFGVPVKTAWSRTGGLEPVLALDNDENIVLAGIPDARQFKLSAETTALALVRLTMGATPADQSAASVHSAILGAASWPPLVLAIREAHETGVTLSKADGVAQTVRQVISELPETVFASTAVTGPNAAQLAGQKLALPTARADQLPFRVQGLDGWDNFAVAISGASLDGGVAC